MAEEHQIVISIDGQNKFKGTFTALEDATKKITKNTEDLNRAADKSGISWLNLKNIILGATAIQVARFFLSSAEAASNQEKAINNLSLALKNQNRFSAETVKALDAQATALQKVTIFQDDQILAAQAQLVQFGVTGKTLEKLTQATLEYASATGKDLTTAVNEIGGALQGRGLELKKYGVELDGLKTKTERVKEITETLTEKFTGASALATTTFAGKVKQLEANWDNLKEKIGEKVIPVFNTLIEKANKTIDVMERLGILQKADIPVTATEKRISSLQKEKEKLDTIIGRYNDFNKINAPIPDQDLVGNMSLPDAVAKRLQIMEALHAQEILMEKEAARQKKAINKGKDDDVIEDDKSAKEKMFDQASTIETAIGQMETATFEQKRIALDAESKLRKAVMREKIKDDTLYKQFVSASDIQLAKQKFDLKKAEIDLALTTTQYLIGLAIDAFGKSKDLARAQLVINQALAISKATALIGIPFIGPGLFAVATGLIVAATAKQFSAIGKSTEGLGSFNPPASSPPDFSEPGVNGRPSGEDITGGGGPTIGAPSVGGGSSGGAGNTIINIRVDSPNVFFSADRVDISDIEVVARRLGDITSAGVSDGVRLALIQQNAALKNAGLAV